ncbi:MAG: VWA domain-containing protein [Spirochaetes bacterium]|nr:VWA domain-containing protein [Spirochaetota bacterium]
MSNRIPAVILSCVITAFFALPAFGATAEGWIDDNTFRIIGKGAAPADEKDPGRKKEAARQAALADARARIASRIAATLPESGTGAHAALAEKVLREKAADTLNAITVVDAVWDDRGGCVIIVELKSDGLRTFLSSLVRLYLEKANSAKAGMAAADDADKRVAPKGGALAVERNESEVMKRKDDGFAGLPSTSPAMKSGRGRVGGMMREEAPREAAAMRSAPTASGLKAGFSDDNKQFNYFIGFLEKYNSVRHYDLGVQERIQLSVKDVNGRSVPNAAVTVTGADGKTLASGTTYADGSFLFFPTRYDSGIRSYKAVVIKDQLRQDAVFDRAGKRDVAIALNAPRVIPASVPLDIVFIFDTTGSMGEEIQRLKDTIEIIRLNIAALGSKPKVRFGMVLYRDQGDDYVTKVIPLTEDLDAFQKELAKVEAGGGGDEPEDLQSALKDAVNAMEWNKTGIRLAFVITDASSHLDYGQKYTYADAAVDANRKGIKIFTVGTGGLPVEGEYVLRQVAQYTYAKYIFLTYGERGDSDGGAAQSVSHHTGANFTADKLETVIMKFAREELAFLADKPLTADDEFFAATKTDEKRDETVGKLFGMALGQLVDYSSISIRGRVRVSLMPFSTADRALAADAEYFGEQLSLVLSRSTVFTQVERKDLQKIMKELELTMTGLTDEKNAAKVGKLLGAQMLITGQLFAGGKEQYELFLKLVNVETGEILSVTKAKIDRSLGLGR